MNQHQIHKKMIGLILYSWLLYKSISGFSRLATKFMTGPLIFYFLWNMCIHKFGTQPESRTRNVSFAGKNDIHFTRRAFYYFFRIERILSFRSRSICRRHSCSDFTNFLKVPGGLPQTSSIVFVFTFYSLPFFIIKSSQTLGKIMLRFCFRITSFCFVIHTKWSEWRDSNSQGHNDARLQTELASNYLPTLR